MVKHVLVAIVLGTLLACNSSKKQPHSYIGLKNDTAGLSLIIPKERFIQKGDLLSIVVYSDNPSATAIYNQPIMNPNITIGVEPSSNSSSAGYLVDENGNIQFQSIGNFHVEGLSKQQLSDSLILKLSKYLTNPYCSIRLLNYRVTVMGEVMKPNTYTIPNERITVLEAIGMAGDISLYGRKDNVMIIRESNGKREFGVLDLRDPQVFKSEYYYLRQNDMVIVDQLKNKQQASDMVTLRNISILATIVSTLAIVYSAVRN